MYIVRVFVVFYLLLTFHLMTCASLLAYERHVLAAGRCHSLFVDKNGLVWGWGNGSALGLASEPVTPQIAFEKAISVAAASYNSLALREDGTVWGWGDNSLCPLTTVPLSKAIPTKIFSDVIAFGVGSNSFRTFAIKSDRSLWGWGWAQGGLGIPEATWILSCDPRRILDNVEQVAMGSEHTLALVRTDPATNGGRALQLMGWGSNDCWQLGEYDLGNQTTPVSINPWKDCEKIDESIRDGLPIVKVAAAGIGSFALIEDGTIWGWGNISDSVYCRAGQWFYETRRLEGMDNVKDISAGLGGLLALKKDGTLWGRFWHRRTSLKTENIIEANDDHWAFILDNVQEMSAGGYHGIALKKDGTVWTWGNNNRGQLGRSKENDYTTPLQVMFPSPEETAIQLKKFREKMKAGKQQCECLE